MGYGYEYPAAIIITDTNAHTGRFGKVHALKDSEATFVAENITENGSSTINGIEMKLQQKFVELLQALLLQAVQGYRLFLMSIATALKKAVSRFNQSSWRRYYLPKSYDWNIQSNKRIIE